jgi:predicted HTH domain antitoxin
MRMASDSLMIALTLYRCGTLTFGQAATRAGQSPEAFARVLDRFDVPYRTEQANASFSEPTA